MMRPPIIRLLRARSVPQGISRSWSQLRKLRVLCPVTADRARRPSTTVVRGASARPLEQRRTSGGNALGEAGS